MEDPKLVPAPEDHAHVAVAVPEAGHWLGKVAAHTDSCLRASLGLRNSKLQCFLVPNSEMDHKSDLQCDLDHEHSW